MNRYGYLGGKLIRMLVASPLALILLVAGAGQAFADHDPNIIHACVKNGSIQIVSSAADCKSGETPVSLVTEAALQSADASLQAHIDSAEYLAKRLHGYTAAVISQSTTVGDSGMPGHWLIRLTFCDINDVLQVPCDETTGYVLEADSVTGADNGKIFTFSAANSPDFQHISTLLANGQDDVVRIDTLYYDSNDAHAGGISSEGRDSFWFFRNPQVSSAPGFSDLAGLEIKTISVTIDFASLGYNQNTQSTQGLLDYRVFFQVGP